jgi:diaminohydroxyphosphoribosylaminopyrimidine deaminase/5-amino-6-(5-phosphoribosylamino)uracil reductase
VDLTQLMAQLGQREITSVLIEGGGEIHASAIRSGIVDHIMFFLAPILVGGVDAPGAIQGMGIQKLSQAVKLGEMEVKQVGADLLIEASIEDYVYGNS